MSVFVFFFFFLSRQRAFSPLDYLIASLLQFKMEPRHTPTLNSVSLLGTLHLANLFLLF
jgi:hypothetical protein